MDVSSKIMLEPGQLSCIQEILKTHLPSTAQVFAFGSRVTGLARKFSDLDLLITQSQPLSPEVRGALKRAFEESRLPFKVDIIEFVKISARFKKSIEKTCIAIPFLYSINTQNDAH